MKRPLRLPCLPLLFFTLSVLVACGPATRGSRTEAQAPRAHVPTIVVIAEEDAETIVALHLGDTLEVVLAGNPSTGYSWELASDVSLVLMPHGTPGFEAGGSAPGAGGRLILRFVAMAPGQTTLTLVYRRPFEATTPPARSFEVTVVVNP